MTNESDIKQEAPEESGTIELKQRKIHIPFPETFTYANCCAFSIAQMEIRLGFAEIMQDGAEAIPRVGVVLPPEAAAILALVLLQQVKAFEEAFGEIRHPAWKAAKAGQPLAINKKEGTIAISPEGSPPGLRRRIRLTEE